MTSELIPSPESTEIEGAEQKFCLYISGAEGTYAGIAGIKKSLEDEYGKGRVEVFNSIWSKDPQNPNRFDEMADYIQEGVCGGGLDIVAHSMGAVELQRAIKKVKKEDETFFDRKENVENLRIILIAPTGFSKGFKEKFKSFSSALRLVREEADSGIFIVSKKQTELRGVDALTAFPPIGVAPQVLTNALRKAIPELSQYKEGFMTIPLDQTEGYYSKLSNGEKRAVDVYSEQIRLAIESENYDGLRYLVKRYGEVLRKPLKRVFAGEFEDTQILLQETDKKTSGGRLQWISVFIDSFGGKAMEEIAVLKEKGVDVQFVVPEFDIVLPLKNILEFFRGDINALSHIQIVEGIAHASPALRSKLFAKTVRSITDTEDTS